MINDTNPIDISVIKGLVGDDEEVIKMFLNKFVETVPTDMDDIKAAISNNNFVEAKAKAHKMKSSARAIGANNLSELCQKIEDDSVLNEQALLNEHYEQMVKEFTDCKKTIQSI